MKKNVHSERVFEHAHVIFRKDDSGGVRILKYTDLSTVFDIDGLASQVWLAIDGKRSIEAIKASFLKKKKLVPKDKDAEFNKDVDRLVRSLQRMGLIEAVKIRKSKKLKNQ